MTFFQLLIMAILDLGGYILILNRLSDRNATSNCEKAIIILLSSTAMAIFRHYVTNEYDVVISVVLVLITISILYREKFFNTVYIYMISTIIILSLQFCSVLIQQILGVGIVFSFEYGMASHMITLLLIGIVYAFVPIQLMIQFVHRNNRVFKILIINLTMVVLFMFYYWTVDIDGLLENLMTIGILSVLVIFMNFVIIRNGLINQFQEEQIKIYEKYLTVIDELIQELKARQHDFDNHIQALRMAMVANSNGEDTIRSVRKYIDELDISTDLSDLIKLENKVLAGFLYAKKKKAKEVGVSLGIKIEDYEFKTSLKDHEMIELIGNLIDNAFETGVRDNWVQVIFSKDSDSKIIKVSNRHPYICKEHFNMIFKKGYSTKAVKNRGYGLYNIKKIVSKNNGSIEVFNERKNEENYIVFRIVL